MVTETDVVTQSDCDAETIAPITDPTDNSAAQDARPKLSIGLPVYNGAAYLDDAIDSILTQTFRDFELLIYDNASTDETPMICSKYVENDSRVRYVRQPQNVGATKNFNDCVTDSRGDYFKWAAHDDILAPSFLEQCVSALDANPDAALCHSKVQLIDGNGDELGSERFDLSGMSSAEAAKRFGSMTLVDHYCVQVFGVIRRDVLVQTDLIQSYPGSDRVLLADLALRGKLLEIPQYLFFSRDHGGRSIRSIPFHWRHQWFNPQLKNAPSLPHWQTLGGYIKSIGASPLPLLGRLKCYALLLRWACVNANAGRLMADVVIVAAPFTWSFIERIRRRMETPSH